MCNQSEEDTVCLFVCLFLCLLVRSFVSLSSLVLCMLVGLLFVSVKTKLIS